LIVSPVTLIEKSGESANKVCLEGAMPEKGKSSLSG